MASLVLLVVALAAERYALQGSLQARRSERLGGRAAIRGRLAGRDILLVQSGIGRDRARDAVVAAAREFDVGPRGRSVSPAASASGCIRAIWSVPPPSWTMRTSVAFRWPRIPPTPPCVPPCAALLFRWTRAA